MVQRTFTVRLSVYASRKLTEMVAGKSRSAEEIAAHMLEQALFDYDDFVWLNDDPREEQSGPEDWNRPFVELDAALEEFSRELDVRLKRKAKPS